MAIANSPPAPPSDPTPPPLTPPALNRTEKAERALLRGLFQAEWRSLILSQLHPDYLISDLGRRLFERVARTPADEEGNIAVLPLLQKIESEEEQEPVLPESKAPTEDQNDHLAYLSEMPGDTGKNSAKLSDFLREILEESESVLSNEPLNEAAVRDCIQRLKRHRLEQVKREMESHLQRTDLTPEQHRTLVQQYMQQIIALRGSSSGEGAA